MAPSRAVHHVPVRPGMAAIGGTGGEVARSRTVLHDPSPTSISSYREGSMAPDLVLRWRAHWR